MAMIIDIDIDINIEEKTYKDIVSIRYFRNFA